MRLNQPAVFGLFKALKHIDYFLMCFMFAHMPTQPDSFFNLFTSEVSLQDCDILWGSEKSWKALKMLKMCLHPVHFESFPVILSFLLLLLFLSLVGATSLF